MVEGFEWHLLVVWNISNDYSKTINIYILFFYFYSFSQIKFQKKLNLLKRCGDGWRNHPRWWITTNDGYDLISRKFQSWMKTNHNVICKYPCWSLQKTIVICFKTIVLINVLFQFNFSIIFDLKLLASNTCKLPQPFKGIRIVASGFPFPVILHEL